MYKVRHLARAHGKSLQVLMRMSLALLSNHAISRQSITRNIAKTEPQMNCSIHKEMQLIVDHGGNEEG